MPCKVLLGDRVAQMACIVLLGYTDVVKPQKVPGGSIYPSSRSTELVSKRLLAVMNLWQAANLKRTVLENDGPLYDLVTCWRVI